MTGRRPYERHGIRAPADGSRSIRSVAARKAAAIAAVADLVPEIRAMWETEGLPLRAIADRLNADGQKTCGRKSWSAMAVKRVLDRARAGMPPPVGRRPARWPS